MTRIESRTLVWKVNFFKYRLCSWFKNDFTRLEMRTEEGREKTGSVPLIPLSSRWIVPLWLQPSRLVSVTLQVWEPLVPTEKYTFYVTIRIKRICLFEFLDEVQHFVSAKMFIADIKCAKIIIYFSENEKTKLQDSNQIVTQKVIGRL
jgi:hypothetical protein